MLPPSNTELDLLLESDLALNTYLDSVRERRERFLAQSHERNRIQSALDLLTEEHRLTCEAGYSSLAQELQEVIAQFAHRLEWLENPALSALTHTPFENRIEDRGIESVGSDITLETLAVVTARLPEPDLVPPVEPFELITPEPELSLVTEPELPELELVSLTDEIPVSEEREIEEVSQEDPERLARIANYCKEIEGLQLAFNEVRNAGFKRADGQLKRASALRLRRIFCLAEAVLEDSIATGVGDEIAQLLSPFRDQFTMQAVFIDNREMNYHLFSNRTDEYRNEVQETLSAADWDWLAEAYEWTIEAQEAWEWLIANANPIANEALKLLAERIGAAQQLLHRRLDDLNAHDKLQSGLYNELRGFAERRGFFIYALQPDKPAEELIDLALSVTAEWKRLQAVTEHAAKAKEKEAKREECIDAVQKALASDSFGRELTAALACCFEAGVPQTNVQIRNMLIERGANLESLNAFPKLQEGIVKEQERRDTKKIKPEKEADDDEPMDAETEAFRQKLLPDVRGMRMAILGGVARTRTCDQLKSLLELSDCRWLPVEKGKNAQRHRPEIEKADFVFLLKNLASHEMIEKGKEWARAAGKHPVYVPAGNGVKQLVFQLHRYLHSDG